MRREPAKDLLEVLLISRRRKPNSYTVPAGKYDNDLDLGSFEGCAVRETREEAGIDCDIMFDLGWFRSTALKDNSENRTRFFGMQYIRESSDWQEELERQRCWHSLDVAIGLVEWSPMLVEVLQHLQGLAAEDAEVRSALTLLA